MVTCRAVLIVLTMLLAGCAGVPQPDSPEACALVQKAVFPVSFVTNRPVVDVMFDGKASRMMLDTGAEITVLSAEAAARLGLPRDWTRTTTLGGIGGYSIARHVKPAEMELGGMMLADQSFAVASFGLRGFPGEVPDGYLGNDVLGKFDVDLDLPRHRVTLYRARDCATAVPPWRGRFVALPESGQFLRRRVAYVPAMLDGHPIAAILDSGANGIAVDRQAALAAGVPAAALERARGQVVQGLAPGDAVEWAARFGSLRLAGETYNTPMLGVTDIPVGMADMIIGTPWLRRHRIWISFATRKVFVAGETGTTP